MNPPCFLNRFREMFKSKKREQKKRAFSKNENEISGNSHCTTAEIAGQTPFLCSSLFPRQGPLFLATHDDLLIHREALPLAHGVHQTSRAVVGHRFTPRRQPELLQLLLGRCFKERVLFRA